jgi:hypothetical protein
MKKPLLLYAWEGLLSRADLNFWVYTLRLQPSRAISVKSKEAQKILKWAKRSMAIGISIFHEP